MTLTVDYQTFLTTSNPELLASDAQLHYVNTLTTLKGPEAVVKHLSTEARQLNKKEETLISSIESPDAVCLEVETHIQFVTSGGAYLPGLDDNLFSDRTVVFPITHIVRFNANGKIQQIRQQWDQGALLRAVDVIGSRGKNWPIKDGQDQAALIKRSTADAPSSVEELAKTLSSSNLGNSKSPHPTNDPHTTLHSALYEPREERERDPERSRDTSVAPRGSVRPPTRDWDELFPSGKPEQSPSRSRSPSKESVIAPKIGAGKNFAPSRIFDPQNPEVDATGSPVKAQDQHYIKTHPTKYSHFEFHDGHNDPAPTPSQPRPKTKHQSQWDFSDFTTPAKVKQRQHAQSNPQFRIGEEEEPPTMKKVAPKSRPDSQIHFELQDDGTRPADNRPRHSRGQGSQSVSHSLYTDHTLQDSGRYSVNKNEVYKDIKNVSNKDRTKDFAAHFAMEDDPNIVPTGGHGQQMKPTTTSTSLKGRSKDFGAHWDITDAERGLGERSAAEMNRPAAGYRQKAVKTMEAQWEPSDVSPAGSKTQKSNTSVEWDPVAQLDEKENRGIAIAGDGMGGKKGVQSQGSENKGINIGGDGMGGRKDADSLRNWATNDQQQPSKPKGGVRKVFTSSLWDHN